ncbi:sulfuric ester hydrolase [Aureococcus anophagefferens]|nr:sulfuric ester hydrolase [Aureococcus anophagefferens]
MLDDVGFNDVGYASSDLGETTPFLDGLMADGVSVDRLYGQQVCTPSRAAMLTGKLPIHLELQHWQVAPSEPWGLPTREATMAQYLKALGYSTHMVGKWHLGHYNNASTPLNRGFDSFYGFYSGGVDYLTHPPTELLERRNATLLHIPNHDRKNFAALMMNADESLANLTNRGLKATGLYDTAVIVIASDNGGQLLLNIDYLDGSGDYLGYFRAALIIGDWKFIYNEKNISWFAPSDEPNFHLNNIHVSGRLTALYNVTADPGERNDLKSHYPAQMKRMLKKIQNGYLPTMLVSNYRGEDDGCYEAWDDGNFVKPWVSDLREGENARAALVADARADYEGAAFGDDGTYAVDDDADIATTLADLDALIDARR